MTKRPKLLLSLILLVAAVFRLYGLNWDQGQHLHPDERFLTMVATEVKIPSSLANYLNPETSTLNPYNHNFGFFVYGSFPLNLTRLMGEAMRQDGYDRIHFVGRVLSAAFDLGVIWLLFLIGRRIWSGQVGLLAAALYSTMVLPIQLSHFFAVDTFLNFFIVLSFYLLLSLITNNHKPITSTALGSAFGLALACKVSALYFLPIIGLGFLYLFVQTCKSKQVLLFSVSFLLFAFSAAIFFRFNQPQALAGNDWLNWRLNPQFLANLNELKRFDHPNSTFPPALQWKSRTPFLFPLRNLVFWGLGLPLGVIAVAAVLVLAYQTAKRVNQNSLPVVLVLIWVLGLFLYQGPRLVTTMRYFLPLYPFLALLSAKLVRDLVGHRSLLLFGVYCLFLLYPVSFMSIYTRPITRVSASEWIYANIPAGTRVLNEEWDDGLPLGLPGRTPAIYQGESVFMYDEDTPAKWQRIKPILDRVDYLFLSSNRAYGGIMRLPQRYPQTTEYYQSLFNGTGGFIKIAEFTSRPCFPPVGQPWFCFNDDEADEAFTVYDHPKVTLFQKKNQ